MTGKVGGDNVRNRSQVERALAGVLVVGSGDPFVYVGQNLPKLGDWYAEQPKTYMPLPPITRAF